MLGRVIALLGLICVILGVLKFLGVFAFGTASAGALIVVGIILILVAQFVLGGVYGSRSRL